MVYSYCSVEEVIADVISNTRMTDSNYADDILEWLRKGLNLMRVRGMYTPQQQVLEAKDNIVTLPCGIVAIDGIWYNGSRLRLGTSTIDVRCSPINVLKQNFDSYFTTDTTSDGFTKNEQDWLLVRGDDLRLNNSLVSGSDYYIPYPNHLQTSFKCGCLQLFYRKMPVDDRGYPLIPDEENTKYALFWWIMAMLTLTGYKHNDPKMDYDYCEAKWGHYSNEGKKKIKQSSRDKKESILQYNVNLIPPTGYYESFSIGGEQRKFVDK